ncbi:MAG TPA: DUF5690 family protein [Urbifossiella sp.]|nr:DUF5690 family protein [Urbifossiella sp.]
MPAAGLSTAAWCVVAAFGAYFCMYAFRKPFTAGGYVDLTLWDVPYKTVLVVAQVLGYTVSKFLGIKVVSEVSPRRRAVLLLGLIGAAELALVLFALTPFPVNFVWLFLNGVPLGMVFGLVLGVLEGRRHTEALAAGLCASFILADGVTKSAGAYLLAAEVPEFWMPAAAGLLFTPPLFLFVWMLTRVPAPSAADVAARSERTPMTRADRRAFFLRYAAGLTLVGAAYLLVTILRSVRADFAPEIWAGLGVTGQPEVFTQSEMGVVACVLVLNGAAVLIRDNRRAFTYALWVAAAGSVVVAAALLALRAGAVSPLAFMVLHGVGLYLPYIAVHTTVFERLIAMTRDRGNIGYLMYLVDAFGYLGYVAVLLARNVAGPGADFLAFFVPLSWVIAVASAGLLLPAWYYFMVHPATRRDAGVS